jgi:hypothetical protein
MASTSEKGMKKGLGSKSAKGKMHTHAMHVRRASGGGYIATHDMKNDAGEAMGTQEHVIPDADALQDHMQASMGDQPPAGEGDPSMGGGGAQQPEQGDPDQGQ